jgi:hypothetical protein
MDEKIRYETLADEILLTLKLTSYDGLIDQQEILWCLAQVTSRSLGSGNASGLLPYCDLLNHSSSARPPMIQLSDMEETYDELVITVTNIKDGEVREMEEGEELLISYGDLESQPLKTYIKFGFTI